MKRREYRKGEKRKEGEGLGHFTANCDLIGQLSLFPSPSNKYLLKNMEYLLGRILLTRSLAVFLTPAKVYAALCNEHKEALAAAFLGGFFVGFFPFPPLFVFRAGERKGLDSGLLPI